MGAEFLFMDDNARPHRANIVDECLQSEDITRMDWPACSSDLNPIEHVWDMLGRRIADRQHPSTCLPKLRRALLDEWCNIPQDQIDNLILSMPRRFESYRVLKMEVNKEKIRFFLQFFFDKGKNASQVAEIVNCVYGADTVTANYVQFWFRRFRSGIFDFKDAPRTGRPVIENVDKITEIIEVDRHVRIVVSPRR
ncbi:DDE_3 domain-containing protein [Trichonephila clavipes]|nr:DDE_3 domain-containing protein [Trichonephila clavipes]